MDIKEEILNWFDKVMQPKCPECGSELPVYPYYDDMGEVRFCKKCGKVVRRYKER